MAKKRVSSTEELGVPVSEKVCWSVKEAAAMTGLGKTRIYKLTQQPGCDFIIKAGNNHVLIKKDKFLEFLDQVQEVKL